MNKFISGVVVLVVLAAFSAPASAYYNFDGYPVQTRANGTINGETFYDYVPWDSSGSLNLTTYVPSGTVEYAYLYTGVWCGNPTTRNLINVIFNGLNEGDFDDDGNEFGPIWINGTVDTNPNVWCSGCGKSWWYYNVTSLTNAGAINWADTTKISGFDGRVYGIALVVVLQNDSKPLIQYWINDGSDGLNYVTPNNDGTTYFNGDVDNANVTKSALTMIHLTGYEPICYNCRCLKFNGHNLSTDHVDTNDFEMNTWDDTNSNVTSENVTASANYLWYHRNMDPYINICLGMLTLRLEPVTEPDLTVTNIEFPKVMRPDMGCTINATVTNQGTASEAFNVSLYVDSVLNGTVNVEELSASNSTDDGQINFTVNLPKGCYTFKVVADSGGAIGESNEGNNESSDDYSVGYVITVESDDDFEKLDVSGECALPDGCFKNESGTYYIQNLTGSYSIENCAIKCCEGKGISIQNTNAKFVIRNCTIENCAGSGVFFHNLMNGTIEDNIVRDNTKYGIDVGMVPLSVEDPESINILCNELYENFYGIKLIGNKSTVAGNTVRDNDMEGIYVLGNDNELYNNTIEDNTYYGVKLDLSSSGNNVYWNDFTNNNGSISPQAYDNTTTNTWSTAAQVNYCYSGGTYTNRTGNYWSDYTTPDGNGDGIVDIPYPLGGVAAGAKDSYPLMVPWRLCGDVNRDGGVSYSDALKVFRRAIFHDPVCNEWAADTACDGGVSYSDALKVFRRAIFHESLDCCTGCE